MAKLFLKSQKGSGIIDTDRNTAYVKGKTFTLDPNLVFSPGDMISLQGEDYAVLHPEPLFFRDFAKRTAQIIQPWDAAAILMYCSISSGKRVLESGSGSGALSSAILNAVGPTGHLTTVEKDEGNIKIALENVSLTGDVSNWKIVKSSIEEFSSEEKYDAIVLDVPEPWGAVDKLYKNLVSGGKICCYSPTYNQLEKNVASLKRSNFLILESFELLKRNILVRENATRPDNEIIGHTAFMTFAAKMSGRKNRV